MRLDPEAERRLLGLLRERILPVAQKSLRVWKKGDARCRRPPGRLYRTLLHVLRMSALKYLGREMVAMLYGFRASFARCYSAQACLCPPGQGHGNAAYGGTSIACHLLCCNASQHIIPCEEERLRALRHVCSALPRTAQALYKQVSQAELCSS